MELVNQIINENSGSIDYLGNCFHDAERKTNVSVVLVKVHRKANLEFDFTFKPKASNEKQYKPEDFENKNISKQDIFENLEIRYNKAKDIYKEILYKQQELEFYSRGLVSGSNEILKFIKDDVSNPINCMEHFSSSLKKACWDNVFNNTKFSEVVTTSVRKNFYKFQETQASMGFTKENLENLFADIFENKGNIMQKCIEESFDAITKYHEDNRVHIEGWKTNERYKANIKFILPFSLTKWSKSISLSYTYHNCADTITDIEKGLCFISGKKISECDSIAKQFQDHKIEEYNHWYDSEFFEFKCFKKGTIHFKFKSEELWDKFNLIACKNKNWIGN
jgi:hypothetical protein